MQVHDRIVEMTELNDHQKSAIMEKIAVSITILNLVSSKVIIFSCLLWLNNHEWFKGDLHKQTVKDFRYLFSTEVQVKCKLYLDIQINCWAIYIFSIF